MLDLKSVAPDTGVPVRFRFRAPINILFSRKNTGVPVFFYVSIACPFLVYGFGMWRTDILCRLKGRLKTRFQVFRRPLSAFYSATDASFSAMPSKSANHRAAVVFTSSTPCFFRLEKSWTDTWQCSENGFNAFLTEDKVLICSFLDNLSAFESRICTGLPVSAKKSNIWMSSGLSG